MYSIILQYTELKGQFHFTHRHAFGTTGDGEPYNVNLTTQTLDQIKVAYPVEFKEPSFPIEHENQPLFEHRIPLYDSQLPSPHQKIYSLDSEELSALKQEIKKLMATNRIRPSDSPYGAPILFAKMKDGSLRMCIDCRALNINTVADSCPLLRIDEMLTRFKGARYFSRLDLRDGYH